MLMLDNDTVVTLTCSVVSAADERGAGEGVGVAVGGDAICPRISPPPFADVWTLKYVRPLSKSEVVRATGNHANEGRGRA